MDRKQFLRNGLFGGLALVLPKPEPKADGDYKLVSNGGSSPTWASNGTSGYMVTSVGGNLVCQPITDHEESKIF